MTKTKIKKIYEEHEFDNLLYIGFRESIEKLLKSGEWIKVEGEAYSGEDIFSFTKGLFPWGNGGISIQGEYIGIVENCIKKPRSKYTMICDNFGIEVKVYYFADEHYLYGKVIKNVRIPLNFIHSIKKIHEQVGVVKATDENGHEFLTYAKLNEAQEYGIKRIRQHINYLEEVIAKEKERLQVALDILNKVKSNDK